MNAALHRNGIIRRLSCSAQTHNAFHNREGISRSMINLHEQPTLGGLEFLHLPEISHIQLRGEVVGKLLIVISDRAEMQLVPERRSVFLIVQNVDRSLKLTGYRISKLVDNSSIRILSLQKPAVTSKYLSTLILRQVEKRLVGKNDRVIGMAASVRTSGIRVRSNAAADCCL